MPQNWPCTSRKQPFACLSFDSEGSRIQWNDHFSINNEAIAIEQPPGTRGMIDEHDYAFANQESSKITMKLLAEFVGVTYSEIAQSILQTSSFEITKTISEIMTDIKLNPQTTKIIGGGGGASILVPFVAKQLGLQYQKAEHAEIISSIGVASSMLQEEIEQTVINPTPEQISLSHKKIHSIMVENGATPESIVIDSKYIPEKSLLRVTAIGNVELDSVDTTKSVFTLQEAKTRTSEILQISEELIDLSFESDHYLIFNGHIAEKHFFSKKNRHPILVLDRFGKMKMSLKNGKIFQGGKISILEELDDFLESRNNDVAPQVYLVNDFKLIDGPYNDDSTEMFDFIKRNVSQTDIVVFRKPRVMTLLTNKYSIMYNDTKDFVEKSWYVIDKKNTLGGNPDKDITKFIVEKLNKKLPSLKLK